MITVSRRRFLTLASGVLATGCTSAGRALPAGTPSPTSATPPSSSPTTIAPSVVTAVTTQPGLAADDRVLVMVELAGGNDALNTLPPLADAYRASRPTIAVPEDDLVTSPRLDDHALHPALAPLLPLLDSGRLAVAAGIGFADPNRSHFAATDRWLRADRTDEPYGWLGRWLDALPQELPALGATALGSTGALLLGAGRSGTVVDEATAFALPAGLGSSTIRALTAPTSDDPLIAAAQRAYLRSIGAVEEFDAIADAVRGRVGDASTVGTTGATTDDPMPTGGFATALAIAAELVVGHVGCRVVTVKVGGFDTHAQQLDTHARLLADLAAGLVAFWATVDDAGLGDRVLLATHSEFGRRVAENASGGSDHGAAGVSFLIGDGVRGGVHGAIDGDDLLDGDLRPVIDPRTMFTACLDWLDAEVEPILGRRHDEVPLLA
jgi:uncharacterized protein (DUF1501 family)